MEKDRCLTPKIVPSAPSLDRFSGVVTCSLAHGGQEISLTYAHKPRPTTKDVVKMVSMLRRLADDIEHDIATAMARDTLGDTSNTDETQNNGGAQPGSDR